MQTEHTTIEEYVLEHFTPPDTDREFSLMNQFATLAIQNEELREAVADSIAALEEDLRQSTAISHLEGMAAIVRTKSERLAKARAILAKCERGQG